MKIHEIAKLSGVSVRTLQYYDNIGLLKPVDITTKGYRIYNRESLAQLQQILFFKELDFPLKEIKAIITSPHFDKAQALTSHKELLTQKRDRLNNMIELTENIIQKATSKNSQACSAKYKAVSEGTSKEETEMPSFREFDMTKIEEAKQKYAQEAKEKWGGGTKDTGTAHTGTDGTAESQAAQAYNTSEKKTSQYGKAEWKRIHQESATIFQGFAKLAGGLATSAESATGSVGATTSAGVAQKTAESTALAGASESAGVAKPHESLPASRVANPAESAEAQKLAQVPESPEAQALVQAWQNHITKWFYPCTIEILQGLGEMYVTDQRFKQNIDAYGAGAAECMSRAIAYYCENA